MAESATPFSPAEFENRCAAIQRHMEQDGVAALLLTAAADIFYTTGFLTRFWESPARPWFVVIPAKGAPIAVIPAIGAALMQDSWISDIRCWDAPDPEDDGLSLLAETLRACCPAQGAIGLPMGLETHLRMALGDYLRLTQTLAPRRFVDATACIHRAREVKSEAEIDRIRTICTLADRAFGMVPDLARAAPRLDALFRDFQAALLAAGADWVSYTAGGAGQGGCGDVISPAGPQPLRTGDVLMLDTGAVRDGYFCDFDRNFSVGPPRSEVAHAHEALWLATQEVMAEIRPGQRACDVHAMLCRALVARDVVPGAGRLGHGLGVTLTEWPSFTPKDTTLLRANMVLTLEPGVQIAPGRMIVHEENIVLRDDGAELLSPRAPRTLPEITL